MDYITCQVLDYFVFSRFIQPSCIEFFSALFFSVQVHLGNIRLRGVETDVLVTFYEPLIIR